MNRSLHRSNLYFKQQLEYIDENIQELNELYLSSTPIQERIKHFFHLYVLEVEDLLKTNLRIELGSAFPKVLIGTKVTILYVEDDETEDFVICYPNQSDPDSGYISFLSPVGRQLLFKEMGEELSLKIPTGQLPVKILQVSFIGKLFNQEEEKKEA